MERLGNQLKQTRRVASKKRVVRRNVAQEEDHSGKMDQNDLGLKYISDQNIPDLLEALMAGRFNPFVNAAARCVLCVWAGLRVGIIRGVDVLCVGVFSVGT